MKEIPIKFNDTKKLNSSSSPQFYEKYPFKNDRHKKSNSNNPLQFKMKSCFL